MPPDPPLHLGPPDRFATVAGLFRDVGYGEAEVLELLGMPDLSGLTTLDPDTVDLEGVDRPLATLVRLFLLAEPVPDAALEDGPLASVLDDLRALDLVRPGDASEPGSEEGTYHATVLLYPVAGLWVASDRHRNPDGSRPVSIPDVVFPGTAGPTLRFLRILPPEPIGEALDLGTGTGVAALVLSRTAERVVATDVTERAVHFARFNARLNGRDNVEVVRSDVWEGLAGRDFDHVVAHPPFVPAPADEKVFRDAGVTGEQITRRIVAGLPEHLRAGGALHCLCAGWDAPGEPFEVRARGWLGRPGDDFDVVFACGVDLSVEDVAVRIAERAADGPGAAGLPGWRRRIEEEGWQRWVSGALVVARHEDGAEPLTLRRRLGVITDDAAFARALELSRWRRRIEADGEPGRSLADARPHFAPSFRCQVTFSPGPGTLEATDAVAEVDAPFPEALRIEPWMMNVVARLDGRRTVAQVLSEADRDGMVPDGFVLDDLARLVADLVERGHLLLETGPGDGVAPAGGFRA